MTKLTEESKNTQAQKIAANWMKTSEKASQVSAKSLVLGGLLVQRDNEIKAAITGTLNEKGREHVINWIVKQLPATNNSFNDAFFFENAWMVYTIGRLQNKHNDDDFIKQEAKFLVEIRSRFLVKRANAVSKR